MGLLFYGLPTQQNEFDNVVAGARPVLQPLLPRGIQR